MLPHKHFLISAGAAVPVAFMASPAGSEIPLIPWVLIAGTLSALLDIDVLAAVQLKASHEPALAPFRNPLRIFTRFREFMKALYDTGLIRIVMLTHMLLWVAVSLAAWAFATEWFIPVLVGVITHFLSDVPHIVRVATGQRWPQMEKGE